MQQDLDKYPSISFGKPSKNGIINFEYSSDETNFLVISDLYDKKWTAYVDNINTKIYRANLFFKSIEIPKGNHKIILKYV